MTDTTLEPIRVMIVDDSAIIRGIITKGFEKEPNIKIIASAGNGKAAIENLSKISVDVILLDIEMPEMDGITALPKLLQIAPDAKIIMVSALTLKGAEVTLKAMNLGAADFMLKPAFRDQHTNVAQFYETLIQKIKSLVRRKAEGKERHIFNSSYPKFPIKAVAIGCSTGGPQALATLFKHLAHAKSLHQPIFITQHMPATFTTILAKHLEQVAGRSCMEATDGMVVKPDVIYVAQGDYHLVPVKEKGEVILRINQNPQVNFCRPAVDPMLEALSGIYGSNLLAVILTGMGSDGLGGCRKVVQAGGTVIAQDEQSSVVWGMPKAVVENKMCSAVLPLDEIAPYILRACA